MRGLFIAGFIALAVLLGGVGVPLVFAQQPSDAVRNAAAEERSAHLSSLSDRAVFLRAQLTALQEELAATQARLREALAKCAEKCEDAKK